MDLKNRSDYADAIDLALVYEVQDGLPMVSRPYAVIAERLGLSEDEVLRRLRRLLDSGDMRRLGVVVRHRELGYVANAMVVWDIPEQQVSEFGRRIGSQPFVNLCYRRPRRLPEWRYNLFCMIHGRSRDGVLRNLDDLIARCGLQDIEYRVLFSRRRFKQRGARYNENAKSRPRRCQADVRTQLG